MRLFNVHCDTAKADALASLVEAAAAAEKKERREVRAALAARARRERMPAAQLSREVAVLQAERRRALEAGELRGTRTAYVMPSLLQVLDEHGWRTRRWRPVPPAARIRQGRPWGTHDGRYGAKVSLYLPDDLGEALDRACFWTSAPAVARLQAWYDEHGDHRRGHAHNPDARWTGSSPGPTDVRDRERLIAGITTTGSVLREAIDRAVREAVLSALRGLATPD